jgi:hypothetical protein
MVLSSIVFAGMLGNWRLGASNDNLREPPFFKDTNESPMFNQIFAAAYDLLLCRCERMSLLAPTAIRDIRTINNVEKVHGTDIPLVNAERAWAYAMELKAGAADDPCKRRHLVSLGAPPLFLNMNYI